MRRAISHQKLASVSKNEVPEGALNAAGFVTGWVTRGAGVGACCCGGGLAAAGGAAAGALSSEEQT